MSFILAHIISLKFNSLDNYQNYNRILVNCQLSKKCISLLTLQKILVLEF